MVSESSLYSMFIDSFPGFLSIRDNEHKIIYLNEHFRNWVGKYTEIDPLGLTNCELSQLVESNVAEVFAQCHDLTMDFIYNENTNNKIIKFNDDGNFLYFDI